MCAPPTPPRPSTSSVAFRAGRGERTAAGGGSETKNALGGGSRSGRVERVGGLVGPCQNAVGFRNAKPINAMKQAARSGV